MSKAKTSDPRVAQRIKLLRTSVGLTTTDFAKRTDMSQSHVSQLESCKGHPSTKLLARMAQRFTVEPHWLQTGLGWMVSPSEPHAWLAPLLRLAAVQRVVILRSVHGPEGVLVEVADGVISARLNLSLDDDESTQSYIALLYALKSWGGPVARVVARAWQENRFEELDLSTLFKDVICTSWIVDDELAQLKPRGSLTATRLDRVTGRPGAGAVKMSGRNPAPVTPKMLKAIAGRDPELAAIIEMLEDSDIETRAKVYTFLLTRRQAANALADQLVAAIQPLPARLQRSSKRQKP